MKKRGKKHEKTYQRVKNVRRNGNLRAIRETKRKKRRGKLGRHFHTANRGATEGVENDKGEKGNTNNGGKSNLPRRKKEKKNIMCREMRQT